MKRFFIIACIVILAPLLNIQYHAMAQNAPYPKHEFRGVWVTTVYSGLDWGGTGWPSPQERMEFVLNRAERLGLNAIVFQAVGRGDAMYPSERLPWAYNLTGTAGEDPGYDPLQMWIDATHERGMEFHAWFNVFMTTYLNDMYNSSDHISKIHPEWIENEEWINPGIPEAREWQVQNVLELVENYDIDAIHFDYIRYDNQGFSNDSETMAQHNPDNISGLDNWRRHNVNEFIREVYEGVQDIKPWVKIGSAPVGHYNRASASGWSGLWGYDSVFQDSRHWAEQGHMDYIAPQVYWTIGSNPTPRFEYIVEDWIINRKNDRHIYIGTNPSSTSRPIRSEIHHQIDTTRAIGAEGQIHFRYQGIAQSWDVFKGAYDQMAVVPPMPWRNMEKPDPIEGLQVKSSDFKAFLEWNEHPANSTEEERISYVIYRVEAQDRRPASDIINDPSAIIGTTGKNTFTEAFEEDDDGKQFKFLVTALSRNNVESNPQEATVIITSAEDTPKIARSFKLFQNYPNPFNPVTQIRYELPVDAEVTLQIFDITGRKVETLLASVNKRAGSHTVSFDASELTSGVYVYRLQVAGQTITRRMTLLK